VELDPRNDGKNVSPWLPHQYVVEVDHRSDGKNVSILLPHQYVVELDQRNVGKMSQNNSLTSM
jgi:hypothetical protein